MSSIETIKSYFNSSGFARANRYKVYFPDEQSEDLNILCDSIAWPGRQVLTQDHYTTMRGSQRAYAFGGGTLSITFLLSNDWRSWDFLNEWQRLTINDVEELQGYRVNYFDEYTKDIIVQHLDVAHNPRKTIKIFNAFPNTLNALELSNAAGDILKCSAEFVFENWKIIE